MNQKEMSSAYELARATLKLEDSTEDERLLARTVVHLRGVLESRSMLVETAKVARLAARVLVIAALVIVATTVRACVQDCPVPAPVKVECPRG